MAITRSPRDPCAAWDSARRGGGNFAKPYERVDLNFSYTAIPGWDLSLHVRNLFDARYLETVVTPQNSNFFGSPTAVLFRAEYNFDL